MRVRAATLDCALRWATFLSEIDATHDHFGEHSALYGYERSWPTVRVHALRRKPPVENIRPALAAAL